MPLCETVMTTMLNGCSVTRSTAYQGSFTWTLDSQSVLKSSSLPKSEIWASQLQEELAGLNLAIFEEMIGASGGSSAGILPSGFQSSPISLSRARALSSIRPWRLGDTLRMKLQ